MPIGVIINALSIAVGGVIGALFGHKLPTKLNSELTKIFGICSMGMGVSSIGLMKNMPAVIFAVIIGTAFGLAVNLGEIINNLKKKLFYRRQTKPHAAAHCPLPVVFSSSVCHGTTPYPACHFHCM